MGLFGKKSAEAPVDTSKLTPVSAEELAKHTSKTNLWIAIEGLVYDVTKWQEDHPGGDEILQEHGGKDASEDFEDVGHSKDARKEMKKFLVGKLI